MVHRFPSVPEAAGELEVLDGPWGRRTTLAHDPGKGWSESSSCVCQRSDETAVSGRSVRPHPGSAVVAEGDTYPPRPQPALWTGAAEGGSAPGCLSNQVAQQAASRARRNRLSRSGWSFPRFGAMADPSERSSDTTVLEAGYGLVWVAPLASSGCSDGPQAGVSPPLSTRCPIFSPKASDGC
jgi:hypothetical protein